MEQNVIVGLITFFLGLILGHRLSLGRDKRKEFNNLTMDTYRILASRIKSNDPEIVPIDVDVLSHYFCIFRRRCFREAAEQYQCATNTSDYDPSTGIATKLESAIAEKISHAKTLLAYLEPR